MDTGYRIWEGLKLAFGKIMALRMLGRKRAPEKHKRIHGRRIIILNELLHHKWLDHYEIARRTGIPFRDVSKLLSTAFRDGEHIERIKRQVDVPAYCQSCKKREDVWVYRTKAPIDTVKDMVDRATESVIKSATESAVNELEKIHKNLIGI